MWMQECEHCQQARSGGLQIWMKHLTDKHSIPTEWPSDRAMKLTGPNALRPYTIITESKKKRRKDNVPRPLNSFMLFAQHIRRNVLRIFSDASNSVISQQLGDLWRTVPRACRTQYDDEANRLVKIHQIEFPNYKYQPKKRHISQSNTVSSSSISSTSNNNNNNNTSVTAVVRNSNNNHSTTNTTNVTSLITTSNNSNNNNNNNNNNSSNSGNTNNTCNTQPYNQSQTKFISLVDQSNMKLTNQRIIKSGTDVSVYSFNGKLNSIPNGSRQTSQSSTLASNIHSSSPIYSTMKRHLINLTHPNESINAAHSSTVSNNNNNNTNNNNNNNMKRQNTIHHHVITPNKLSNNIIYTKLEPKSNALSNSCVVTNNTTASPNTQTASYKINVTSLSSVLPPLLTPGQNHKSPNDNNSYIQLMSNNGSAQTLSETYVNGICDSAYGSSINSASSSSASSPALAELLSPAKSSSSPMSSVCASVLPSVISQTSSTSSPQTAVSLTIANNQTNVTNQLNKAASVHRKIQFIPIRPQSQQSNPVQPTRQRFLSATNGISSNINYPISSSLLMNRDNFNISPTTTTTVDELPRSANETLLSQEQELLVNNKSMQNSICIQLDPDLYDNAEGLILTLPPGTRLIQTNMNNNNNSNNNNNTANNNNNTNAIKLKRQSSKRHLIITNNCPINQSRPIQLLQPLKLMNIIQNDSIQHSTNMNDHYPTSASTTPYSYHSSPNSVLSPLSGDVFLPLDTLNTNINNNENNSNENNNNNHTNNYHFTTTTLNDVNSSGMDTGCDDLNHIHTIPVNADINDNVDICMNIKLEEMTTNPNGLMNNLIVDWSSPTNPDIMHLNEDHFLTLNSNGNVNKLIKSASITSNDIEDSTTTTTITTNNTTTTTTTTAITSTTSKNINNNNIIPTVATMTNDINETGVSEVNLIQNRQMEIDSDITIDQDTDQFDTSFDAMMNSIDITSFLPGTFSTIHTEQMNGADLEDELKSMKTDQYSDMNEMEQLTTPKEIVYNANILIHENENFHPSPLSSSSSCSSASSSSSSSSPPLMNEHSTYGLCKLSNNHHTSEPILINDTIPISVTTQSLCRFNSFQDVINSNYTSSLDDLDSIDKSSLFIIKPEWSVSV